MKPSTMRPLTPSEQEFATKHHNLIYTYLHNRKLDIDDFYDIVIFGYLRAVTKYHDRKDLQKYSFSVIAWRCMNTAYWNYCTVYNGKTNSLNINALRLDSTVAGNDDCTISDIIPASGEVHSRIEYMEFFQETVSLLPFLQRKLLIMKLHGNTKWEINKAMRLSV